MSKMILSQKLTLVLAGCLFIQFSNPALADSSTSSKYTGNLIDQLDPNDACAWWNTTNPDNCTGTSSGSSSSTPLTSSGSSTNNDPWNWGGGDPVWNSGGDNGVYSGTDPNNNFGGGSFGGMYSPPQMGFLEKQMYSVLSADYTAAVVQDMKGHGLWDSEAQDAVADEIINKYSTYSAAWGVGASVGVYLLDYVFLDKWRMSGGWYAGSIGMMGAGSTGVLLGESFKVMQNQLSMLLELMELYGELPTNITQRANELSVALNASLVGNAAGTFVNRMLALETAAVPVVGSGLGTGVSVGAGTTTGLIAGETFLGEAGVATTPQAEKAAAEIVLKSGLLKAGIERFGATKFGAFMAEHSTFFKIAFATAFAAGANYGITKLMGQHYKKAFRKIAQVHEHNVIESFKNDSNAKQAVWLILTKYVFRPDGTDDALTPDEAKLYAAIVSQQIPLLHFGTHNEADSLFKQYKAQSAAPTPPPAPTSIKDDPFLTDQKPTKTAANATPNPTPAPTPKNAASDIDFGLGSTPIKPSATPKGPNEIDQKLEILNVDLDLQQRLFLVKLVEGGMLMKGFLSPRDDITLQTISIALNLSPQPKHPWKDSDVRQMWHVKYMSLRDGMVGEVNKKVMAFQQQPALKSKANKSGEETIPKGDLRNRSGEIIMEDFYKPEQVALRAFADRINLEGVIEQKDFAKFDAIAPILEGQKKLPAVTKLPDNTTADGTPRVSSVQQQR